MNFLDTNSEIIFSRSCNDLEIINIPIDCRAVKIEIFCDDINYAFSLSPRKQRLTLRLTDILRSLEFPATISTIGIEFMTFSPKRIEIEAKADDGTSARWQGEFVPGYCNMPAVEKENLLSSKYWWTFRNQTARTYQHAKEYLLARFGSSVSISITYHFSTAGKKTFVWYTSTYAELLLVNCSYSVVRKFADYKGYTNDRIIAYDIWGSDNLPVGQRFVVCPNDSRVKGWVFRNSLGAFDTVFSSGDITRSIDSEMTLFLSKDTEIELSNLSKEIWDINTGYINDRKELELWYEFFRSKERYVILNDGALSRIVIDESSSKSQIGKLGNLSFKCRFSKEIEGYDFTKQVLEDFSDEYT